MSRRIAITLAGAIVVAVVAFFGGRELRGDPEVAANAFDTAGPSYFANHPAMGKSIAGFTGAGAIEGRPVFSGEIVSIDGSIVTIATASGEMTIDITGDSKLWQLAAYDGAIAAGDSVVVRQEGETAVALLLIDR